MDRTLGPKIVLVAAVIVGVGLVCRCKEQDRNQQIFDVVETDDISTGKFITKLHEINNSGQNTPRRVVGLMAKAINKSENSLMFGNSSFTYRELLDLNMFDSKSNTDCTLTEIERRQEVCVILRDSSMAGYCDYCVQYLIEYCRKFPYLRILEISLANFDWHPYEKVAEFSRDVATYIVRDGSEESSVETNVAAYLDTVVNEYRKELKTHCKSFEKDLKGRLYHFGSSPEKTIELVKEIDEELYTVWERCHAVEEGNTK